MRTKTPRLPPLEDGELDAEQEAVIARFRNTAGDRGIVRTFVRHPRMLRAYNGFANHTFSADNTLSKRESEIVTMRTLWHCKAGYQWSRHVPMALRAGLSEAEIEALKQPVDRCGWNDREAALIVAVDELTTDYFISDTGWARLAAHFDDRQCIDAVLLCGRYVMAAMFINSAGVPIDADVVLDPDLDMTGTATRWARRGAQYPAGSLKGRGLGF